MEEILARRRADGISPVSKDFSKILVRAAAISSAATLSIRAGTPSGPVSSFVRVEIRK